MKLKGKTAVVTGGGGGLGEGICLCLAREGANVVVSDIDQELADIVTAKVRNTGSKSLAINTDVSREDDVKRLMEQTCNEMGDMDILVCCAGVSGYSIREAISIQIEEMPVELWDETFAVNMKGVFLCNRAAVPIFRKKNQGRIVNISSIAGRKGSDLLPVYSASKAAVISFTQNMALQLECTVDELAHSIRMHPTFSECIMDAARDASSWALYLPPR